MRGSHFDRHDPDYLKEAEKRTLRQWDAYLGKLDLIRTHMKAGTDTAKLDDLRRKIRRHGQYLVNMGVLLPGEILPPDVQ
jgi:hypothetical protein